MAFALPHGFLRDRGLHITASLNDAALCATANCAALFPLRVKSGRDALKFRCPLYPRKRTFAHAIRMSPLGQKRTHAPQKLSSTSGHFPAARSAVNWVTDGIVACYRSQ